MDRGLLGLLGLLLTHGSYALLFGALVAGGLGLPLPGTSAGRAAQAGGLQLA